MSAVDKSAALSSPERAPLITYLDRKKRKRTISNQSDAESDASSESKPIMSPPKSPISPRKVGMKTPASKVPKKVDVSLPGPSPKRVRRDSSESEKPKSKKYLHIRAASSVTSLKQVIKKVQETPASAQKPPSVAGSARKPKSTAKSIADDDDDNVSIADSSVSTNRVRRNEAERIQYFENQQECGKMEPHQVHCLRCSKPVNLGRKQTYAVRPWEIHRARCDQRPAYAPLTTPRANEPSPPTSVPHSPTSVRPAGKPTPARRPSEQERKEFLESDKQIETVEKHRVLCRKCQDWVDLSQANAYATGSWMKHKVRCSDVVPSNRVASAKRRLLLVNDPQARSFDARNIQCAHCSASVKLEGEGDYNLTQWDEHKLACNNRSSLVSKSDHVSSVPFPSQSSRPPPSSASTGTEDTIVVEAGPSRPANGLKRAREDPDAVPEEDGHKTIRPRTEAYIPPKLDPPNSLLGWFMMPFQSFVRGFKESLKDRA
jgi:hypothetical protein